MVSLKVTPENTSSGIGGFGRRYGGFTAGNAGEAQHGRTVVRVMATPVDRQLMEAGSDESSAQSPSDDMAGAKVLTKDCIVANKVQQQVQGPNNSVNDDQSGVVSCSIEGLLPNVDYSVSLQALRVIDDYTGYNDGDYYDDYKDEELELLSSLEVPDGPFRARGPLTTTNTDGDHANKGMNLKKHLKASMVV